MKTIWGIAFGLVCGILGVGILLLASRGPTGEPIQLLPPPTEAPLMVHVIGGVKDPGVYSLPRGSRVQDAIQAAGGPAEAADTASLNLVKILEDGAQIWVALEKVDPTGAGFPDPEINDPVGEQSQSFININTATQVELESLPGIGPVRAQAILQYRQENGPFHEIGELQNISGIGPATFELLKGLITVGGVTQD